jgi:putative heme-binding domain-containing protein
LKKAAAKKSKTELLDNILEPSRQIAPEYVLYTAALDKDEELSGIIVQRNERELVLRDAGAVDHVLDLSKVKALRPQQLSAMPEGLLAGLTAQEAADLLAALLNEAAP